jgi:hypothetical protein
MKHFNHLVKLFFFSLNFVFAYTVSRGTESYQALAALARAFTHY